MEKEDNIANKKYVTSRLDWCLTQVKLEAYSETFRLRHIMECDLLKWKDEVEDVCIGAKKEQEIDLKLRQVYKSRN